MRIKTDFRNISGIILIFSSFFFNFCEKDDNGEGDTGGVLQFISARVGDVNLIVNDTLENVPPESPILLSFSSAVDSSTIFDGIELMNDNLTKQSFIYSLDNELKKILVTPLVNLNPFVIYQLSINHQLKGINNENASDLNFYFKTREGELNIQSVSVNGTDLSEGKTPRNVELDVEIILQFDYPVANENIETKISLYGKKVMPISIDFSEGNTVIKVSNQSPLDYYTKYNLFVSSSLVGANGYSFDGFINQFYTGLDSTPKFPAISDDELLTLIQQQTFKYFYDFGHPVSGLIRERNTSGDIVTSGGSGFGLMALIVGMERDFITRDEGLTRLNTILNFLENADRFHGAWSHWLNGNSGAAIPFSTKDNGGDLVETSYLIQGLLTIRQYLDSTNNEEKLLINKINDLWHTVEWSWYTRGGQNTLYWHWSENYGWDMNMEIRGYNEALITYICAAGSPTFGIEPDVYHNGWARNGAIVNGNTTYGYVLPLGYSNYGGPLFFEQYTYMGLNPQNLSDRYADYNQQTINHTLINRAYCIDNPRNYIGYSKDCWGLTASDNHEGYSAHSPTNDLGVITPTAAISSIAFTPEYSMDAIKHFYYRMGDRLWGEYGFYDAFNVTEDWYASSYLAIDQGPIIIMIENYRTGLLWDLFMSCPEIKDALDKLDFTY